MNLGSTKTDEERSVSPATDAQLAKQFSTIAQEQRQLDEIKRKASMAEAANQTDAASQFVTQAQPLVAALNLRLTEFQKDLMVARQARPQDPVVQWLTGELLLAVGGEPAEVIPYFKRAASGGLKNPELSTSLAKVEFDLNRFQSSHEDALNALQQNRESHEAWEIYSRASFALEDFSEVLQRLDQTFPGGRPEWAQTIGKNARQLQSSWQRELALRTAESDSGLPLVRFTVEHRRFANGTGSNETSGFKNTGQGEVVLELFEDQAPATVASFIHLVESGFYSGTSFYWAEAGHFVAGGDPNTKNADPTDDGFGGPGYTIPDESRSPRARDHFRGTISMIPNRDRKFGSQFFVSLVPAPALDGVATVFGRVIQGQEVLDQITQGRTNRQVGQFGKIIPGDLLMRAEVIRKRPHNYTFTKLPQ